MFRTTEILKRCSSPFRKQSVTVCMLTEPASGSLVFTHYQRDDGEMWLNNVKKSIFQQKYGYTVIVYDEQYISYLHTVDAA